MAGECATLVPLQYGKGIEWKDTVHGLLHTFFAWCKSSYVQFSQQSRPSWALHSMQLCEVTVQSVTCMAAAVLAAEHHLVYTNLQEAEVWFQHCQTAGG